MKDHLHSAIEDTVRYLLPGTAQRAELLTTQEFSTKHPKWQGNMERPFGTVKEGQNLFLWLKMADGRLLEISIQRNFPLSDHELRVFKTFGSTLEGFLPASDRRASRTAAGMASFSSLGDLLVARSLSPRGGSTFYTPLLILNELKNLALRRYEGTHCTSGIVYARDAYDFLAHIDRATYDFDKFECERLLDVGFFSDPATYRYVDGRNGFYLIDNWRKVHGVLRVRNTGSYTLTDRAAFAHLRGVGGHAGGGPGVRSFVAFVGRNSDVQVITRGDLIFRWENLHWSMFDRKVLPKLLHEAGLSESDAEVLARVLLSVSDLRMGGLVLIAENVCNLPASAGSISSSSVSQSLHRTMEQKQFSRLVDSGAALGVITSDGLTVLSKAGEIVQAGKIIDLRERDGEALAGGGRTQAALAASRYGLAVKVSEDGPISVYRNGECLAKFAA